MKNYTTLKFIITKIKVALNWKLNWKMKIKYAVREIDDYTGCYYSYFISRKKALRKFCEYCKRKNAGECFISVDLMDMRTGEIIASI